MAKTIKTSAGLSINDLAIQLKAKNPQMKFEDAKKRAKEVVTAQATIKHGGGALRHKILTGVLGKTLGGSLAQGLANKNEQEKAATVLAEHHNQMAEQVPSKDLDRIFKKLEAIDKEVKELKAQKVHVAPPVTHMPAPAAPTSAPPPTPTSHNAQKLQDAVSALKNAGFKQQEAIDALQHVDHTAELGTIIRQALQNKDKAANGQAIKIFRKDVPKAVEEARPFVGPPVPVPEAAVPHPVASPTATPTEVPPPAPPPPKPLDNISNDDKKEAMQMKGALKLQNQEKERAKREEETNKKLDEIMKSLKNDNLNDLILKAVGWLAGKALKAMGKGIAWILKQAGKAIMAAGKAVINLAKKLFKSVKSLLGFGEKAGVKAAEKTAAEAGEKALAKGAEKVAAEEGTKLAGKTLTKTILKKIPIVGALVGLGFAADELIHGDVKGAALDAASGIASTLPGLGTAASLAIDAAHAGLDVAGVTGTSTADKAKSAGDADRIAKSSNTDPDDLPDLDSDDGDAPPVIVHQDNRKTVVQQASDDTPLIKVRNDEPTFAMLTSSLFDHPVSYGGVYRL